MAAEGIAVGEPWAFRAAIISFETESHSSAVARMKLQRGSDWED